MATIRSYTDVVQSKKLTKILPIESADMCYQKVHAKQEYFDIAINVPPENQNDLPCWSLTALLSVLPYPHLEQNYKGKWYCRTEHVDTTYLWEADNPVDACYEIVLKLKEKNLL